MGVWGINRSPVNSPHKRSVTRRMFSFDDVIMHFSCSSDSPWSAARSRRLKWRTQADQQKEIEVIITHKIFDNDHD